MCGAADEVLVARAALHFWEEPPLSGEDGSGTVFFSHCPLGCSYCQNGPIARGEAGAPVSVERLAGLFRDLEAQGALNVNLVTATHYAPQVRAAVSRARAEGLALPVVWNTSGYETPQAVAANRGTVDVYLADLKYADAALGARYSQAPDYPAVALAALDAMVEAVGSLAFDEYHGQERLVGGVIVRHLLLPGAVRLSLMSQYTPVLATAAASGDDGARRILDRCPELGRTVPPEDYETLLDYADELGIEDYYWQDGPAAAESFIPAFDLTGL